MPFHQNQVMKKMIDEELVITTQDFMFNTLNSIARMALFEDSPKTEEMIFCLSDLLRYNLEYYEDFKELKHEINYLRQYLYIQQIRFGDRIRYHIDLPERLEEYRIPSFVLLPILEHIFMKRIESMADRGGIYLTVKRAEDKLLIELKEASHDSISHKLVRINRKSATSVLSEEVRKVHQTIIQYFGEEYGVFVEENEQNGVEVRVLIPCFKELSLQNNFGEGGNICLL